VSILVLKISFSATTSDDYSVNSFPGILNHPAFVRTRETVILHYSEGQSLITPQVHDVVNSYATLQRVNFVVIVYEDNSVITTGVSQVLMIIKIII
jgi:hypothetical protein